VRERHVTRTLVVELPDVPEVGPDAVRVLDTHEGDLLSFRRDLRDVVRAIGDLDLVGCELLGQACTDANFSMSDSYARWYPSAVSGPWPTKMLKNTASSPPSNIFWRLTCVARRSV
jgi:hypothetical protein